MVRRFHKPAAAARRGRSEDPYLEVDLKYYDLGRRVATHSRQCNETGHNRQ
jgi:hypothetical protein